MKKKVAHFVSLIGNPLVLSVLVAVYANFKIFDWQQALTLTMILAGVGVVPVFWFINRRVQQGRYADHDVSARKKRPDLYRFSLVVLALMIGILYWTGQPKPILNGALAAWVLAAVSFGVNFRLKTSLHTGYAFLIGFLSLSVGFWLGMGLIAFAFLVGWSRIALGRHTLQEVFTGASLGSIIGCAFHQYMFF
ncbi:MAG: hypothetical protein ACK4GN_09325 [Runella sp.]